MVGARARVLLAAALCVLACGGEAATRGPSGPLYTQQPTPTLSFAEDADSRADDGDEPSPEAFVAGGLIPIDSDDAVWGGDDALVILVGFLDYQCPYCKKSWATLARLSERYGEDLRIAIKHNPLPFHKQAKPTAIAAQAVLDLGGIDAFRRFSDLAFEHQAQLSDERREHWADSVGVPYGRFNAAVDDSRTLASVEGDMALAQRLGATGTPSFRINGVRVNGALPFDVFARAIDEELPQARAARDRGLSAAELYEQRVAANHDATADPPESKQPAKPDLTVYRIPVGRSPTLGPSNALVTVVQFAGFQCPYCKKVQATLEELRKRYPKQIRIVFKHNPMPYHKRARPAANLAIYAFKKGGSAKFYQAVELLFASAPDLSDEAFRNIATQLKLSPQAAIAAANADHYGTVIDADMKLAKDFEARGTPQFFINGRRLKGAQPIEKFVELVDDRLAVAKQMVRSGTPRARVYAAVMKGAQGPPPPPQLQLGPVPSDAPSLGPSSAPIVIRMLGDLQCPYTARAWKTIQRLRQASPHRIRVVWHHLPLDFHKRAVPAAEAAIEVREQLGDAAFWKMVETLFGNQQHLTDQDLEMYARKHGADMTRFRRAMAAHTHRGRVQADKRAANAAGATGTPTFSIGGYLLSGAQSQQNFQDLIDYALKHPAPGAGP